MIEKDVEMLRRTVKHRLEMMGAPSVLGDQRSVMMDFYAEIFEGIEKYEAKIRELLERNMRLEEAIKTIKEIK